MKIATGEIKEDIDDDGISRGDVPISVEIRGAGVAG